MRLLYVWPAAEMSVSDVARGYRNALERQGHDIRDYHLGKRFMYHRKAMEAVASHEAASDPALLSRQASENIVVEAIYHQAEYVIIVSGLNLHPIALLLLGRVNIPVAVVFTESPYNDDSQAQWADISSMGTSVDLTLFTNDEYSAKERGWNLLAPAYDPGIHKPVNSDPDEECDVVMIGTGWGERQSLLEAVDWSGINLQIYGLWPAMTPESPLYKHYHEMVVPNELVVSMYCSAKICLNFHRRHPSAVTPGPRAYEIAACGAFQISDPRPGMVELLGGSVPTFETPEQLGDLVRHYLAHPDERRFLAEQARHRIVHETFDKRAAVLVAALHTNPALQGV